MLPFQSIILGLLVATSTLRSHVAARSLSLTTRATDVTCGGQFPKAGDGFGKRPDACSSWSDNPAQVRDKWGSANFGGVCDDHDRCYYTIGSNVDGCNNNFCGGLRDACRKAYCTKIVGKTICTPGVYDTCNAIAGTYCAGVRAVAASTYAKAQDLQMRYTACIANNGGIAPPVALVLCANGSPEGATWTKADGMSCTTTTYVCRSGKITEVDSHRTLHCTEP